MNVFTWSCYVAQPVTSAHYIEEQYNAPLKRNLPG